MDIVGKVNQADAAYWQTLEPLVDGQNIRYLGAKNAAEVASLMGKAQAVLFPSQQPEAFGQVTIEAQACGTPVIISDVGASRELVQDQRTGFVCDTRDSFIVAIKSVSAIDRAQCRLHASTFDIGTMVRRYDDLYLSLMKH